MYRGGCNWEFMRQIYASDGTGTLGKQPVVKYQSRLTHKFRICWGMGCPSLTPGLTFWRAGPTGLDSSLNFVKPYSEDHDLEKRAFAPGFGISVISPQTGD